MDKGLKDVSDEQIKSMKAPTLLILGDSDLVRPEHAVEWFRLLGGGVFGDMPPVCRIPSSRSCRERRMSPSSIALSYWCQ